MSVLVESPETRARPSGRFRPASPVRPLPGWAAFLLISGLYLTLRGYHAFDGDQAYRLPLLLHRQDPSLFAADPFVRAFDAFNPHRGYLALLDLASRPFGLATALLGLFGLTLLATIRGVSRLARSAWPDGGARVGYLAVVLVLAAKAGNIGTNHLFEATLLDRLVGFGLGWLALAAAVADPARGAFRAAPLLGLATWIHPSVGLQLAMTLGASWLAWGLMSRRTGARWGPVLGSLLGLGLAVIPGLVLMLGQGATLFRGLPVEEFRQLAVLVQGPQHMLPSLWRMPQWLAWGCYPVLGLLALGGARGRWPEARVRLALLMAVNLASLALAYVAVEVVGDLRVTLFQPFRMATLARGLALVAVSGRIVALWDRAAFASRARAVLIVVGLSGDRMLVVATAVDLGMASAGWIGGRWRARAELAVGIILLALGLVHLSRHDTESGHRSLLASIGLLAAGTGLARFFRPGWTDRRRIFALGASWAVPASALVAGWVVSDLDQAPWAEALVGRCRFVEAPVGDLERLAAWARENTPATARFIGPPGPKEFRLWSRRALAFNRAGSPYHAEGLADWADRYRDHVGFDGPTSAFVAAYLADRHELEARYGRMTDAEKANLARRQGAGYILAAAPAPGDLPDGRSPLSLIRVDGRYAIYRVDR